METSTLDLIRLVQPQTGGRSVGHYGTKTGSKNTRGRRQLEGKPVVCPSNVPLLPTAVVVERDETVLYLPEKLADDLKVAVHAADEVLGVSSDAAFEGGGRMREGCEGVGTVGKSLTGINGGKSNSRQSRTDGVFSSPSFVAAVGAVDGNFGRYISPAPQLIAGEAGGPGVP